MMGWECRLVRQDKKCIQIVREQALIKWSFGELRKRWEEIIKMVEGNKL
jgi:hypothetical protein